MFFKSLFEVRCFCLFPCERTAPDSIYLFPEGLGQCAYCIDYTGRSRSQLGWSKVNEITPDLNQCNEAQNRARSFVVCELVFSYLVREVHSGELEGSSVLSSQFVRGTHALLFGCFIVAVLFV